MRYGQDHSALTEELLQPYRFDVKRLDLISGHHIIYTDEGPAEEPVLLMLHGLGGYIKHWYPCIEDLSKEYRCIAVDLPGYGSSSQALLSENDILTAYANAIDDLCLYLAVTDVTLIGHSMGAQIAILIALNQPDWLAGLVLAAPAGFETFSEEDVMHLKKITTVGAFLAQTEEQIRASFAMNFVDQPEWVEEMIQDRLALMASSAYLSYCEVRSAGVLGMLNHPVRGHLSEVNIKTLVLFGSQDQLIPNQTLHPELTVLAVAEAYQDLPEAQLKLMDKAGHLLQVDQWTEFNAHIKTFLSSSINNL